MLYISKVELRNFRCFERLNLETELSASAAPWTLLTGDNASGKTTLLKAIALGLCDRSSAAGLLRESDSGYIRDGQESSTIRIHLRNWPEDQPNDTYSITTHLRRLTDNLESLEQDTHPEDNFPWKDIFVCGYGAGRGTSGTGDIAGYTPISAVYNLFNYTEGLQNPELTIRRLQQSSGKGNEAICLAKEILDLPSLRLAQDGASDAGIWAQDPRGIEVAMRDLADGYKSTFLWITDFLGWALANHSDKLEAIQGIVVIDELEQHLHPKWQKSIIRMLRKSLPRVQFFAATHSPLVARSFRSTGDNGPHCHYHLRNSEDGNRIEAVRMAPMGGMRTDQILASGAFDYLIDDDPDAEEILEELALLAGSEFLTAEERERASALQEIVQEIHSIRKGQTSPERRVAKWCAAARANIIRDLSRKIDAILE